LDLHKPPIICSGFRSQQISSQPQLPRSYFRNQNQYGC